MVTNNVGGADAAIRAGVGSLVLVLAAFAADTYPFLALSEAVVALVVLVTAIAGFCPAYALLGLNTHARPRHQPRAPALPEPAHQLR